MFEGVVENDHIKLVQDQQLPNQMKVYVIVPEPEIARTVHVYSPRLKDVARLDDFRLDVLYPMHQQ